MLQATNYNSFRMPPSFLQFIFRHTVQTGPTTSTTPHMHPKRLHFQFHPQFGFPQRFVHMRF